MNDVIYHDEVVVKKIDKAVIEYLKKQAKISKNNKFRLCLHKDVEEILHEMIIVHVAWEYIRPHKHVNKTETFHIIEGKVLVILFDDRGNVKENFVIDAEGKDYFLFRLAKNQWHTIVPLTEFVVFHEITNGPFIGKNDSMFPHWEEEFKAFRYSMVEQMLKNVEGGKQ